MTWEDLLRKKISELESEQVIIQKKLDKIMKDGSCFDVGKKVELISQISGIQIAINTLYECIGRSIREVIRL